MLAADSDRERAAATLKESYVGGRLTLDELSERTELVLSARSRAELRAALSGLPWLSEELAERGRSVAHAVARGTLVVALTGAWLLFSFVLLLVLGLVLVLALALVLAHDAATVALPEGLVDRRGVPAGDPEQCAQGPPRRGRAERGR